MNVNFRDKKLVIFDLDGTLAESKAPLKADMADLLCKLLEKKRVDVMSGASFAQFKTQFISNLPCENLFSNLFISAMNGAILWKCPEGTWIPEYEHVLSGEEKEKINKVLKRTIEQFAELMPQKIWGEQVEDRGSQITFSALGQKAPLEAKQTWDPDHAKRDKMKIVLDREMPEFEIGIGGATSIDITKKGINKRFGIRKLAEFFDITKEEIVYVGDATFPGGNDYGAVEEGVDVITVKNLEDTKEFIRQCIHS
jgi:phosphomannomutase